MVRKLLLVVSVAFAAALFLQCGTPKGACSASSCPNGCCDASGTCAAGNTTTACGKGGAVCASCTSGESCTAQVCKTGTGGSGGGGGGASATGGGAGNTGGGTATGGGAGSTGGGTGMSCNITSPSCAAGSVCLISSNNGMSASCFTGCDPAAQDCGGGKKCTYVQSGMTFARTCMDAGTVAEGATCAATADGDNCAAGLLCTADNKCTQFCNLSGASCVAGHSCSGILDTMNGEFPLICEPGCSLLTQDCMGAQGCLPAAAGGTVCVTVGTLDAGVTCVNPGDCAKGSACVNTGMKQCLPFCNLDGGAPHCGTGTCTTSMPALPENAGFCL